MRSDRANVSEIFVSFQGEGVHAGRRQLFVRFGGCPLRCRYCDTPESLTPVPTCRILGADGGREEAAHAALRRAIRIRSSAGSSGSTVARACSASTSE